MLENKLSKVVLKHRYAKMNQKIITGKTRSCNHSPLFNERGITWTAGFTNLSRNVDDVLQCLPKTFNSVKCFSKKWRITENRARRSQLMNPPNCEAYYIMLAEMKDHKETWLMIRQVFRAIQTNKARGVFPFKLH